MRFIIQIFHHFFHTYDRICGKAVQLLDFLERALFSLSPLAAVEGNDQSLDFNIGLGLDDGEGFLDGFAGGGYILDDNTLSPSFILLPRRIPVSP